VSTTPPGYDAKNRPDLLKIYSALQSQRGHMSFVQVPSLPRSDFLVRNPGFLFEFDESQHFTESRRVALSEYPKSLPLGFDRSTWMKSCDDIDCHDNTPPFRDEQRAWYDSLRDFLPWTKGMLPTIRVRADEHNWCDFDPSNPDDVDSFRQILGERASFWRIAFDVPKEPLLARVAIDGTWRGELSVAQALLGDVCRKWPSELRVLCLSTCGAFLRFPWPCSVEEQADNFSPSHEVMQTLEACGRTMCESLLSSDLRAELSKRMDYITLGVDSDKPLISTAQTKIRHPHVEFVYIVNLHTGETQFTGKSYPTLGQEKGLLRVSNLESHFVKMKDVTALVLGCHDLTIFNPRADGTVKQPRRLAVKQGLKALCKTKEPSIVLHHPHTATKIGTWRGAWGGLRSGVTSVESFLGSGCYSHADGWTQRNPFSAVLRSTKSPDVVDVVVQMAGMPF
jgi:hypothetical protein